MQKYQEANSYDGYDASRYAPYQPDPVQQYVSQSGADDAYNAESYNAEPSNDLPSYVEPGYNGYSGIVPYGPPGAYNPGAFAVQSGYEGYLVPGPPQNSVETRDEPRPVSALTSSVPTFMRMTSQLGRAFAFLMSLLAVTVFGGGITTAICTFTPLCTISFAIPFFGVRSGFRNTDGKSSIPDATAELLEKSVKMIKNMQDDEKSNIAAKSDVKLPEAEVKSITEKAEPLVKADTPPTK